MNDFDISVDEANEFDLLFGCMHEFGLDAENELKFNGDAEVARKYQENAENGDFLCEFFEMYSQTDACFNESPTNSTGSVIIKSESTPRNEINKNEDIIQMSNNIRSKNSDVLDSGLRSESESNYSNTVNATASAGKTPEPFNLAFYSTPRHPSSLTTFQNLNEPRWKYLVRAMKLYQNFFNGGDFNNLEILYKDIYTKDVLLLMKGVPPMVGIHKLLELQRSLHRNIPDICLFLNDIKRPKRRLFTMKGNSFGSFVYANSNDSTRASWNFMEYAPIEKMDEYHKIQKQKYDDLKGQQKVIRFEKRAIWHFVLDTEMKKIDKIMSCHEKFDIF